MNWAVQTNDFHSSVVQGTARPCTKKELALMSLKKLALFWTLAVVSVVIPVLHFVLVPAFFFIGIFVFFLPFKNTHVLPKGSYRCPKCSATNDLKNFYFNDGRRFTCDSCQVQLKISGAAKTQ